MENNKGITLIALIITIVVLIILAGVSIAAVASNNGILDNAAESKVETEKEQIISDAQIDILEKEIEKQTQLLSDEEVEGILVQYGTIVGTEEQKLSEKILKTPEGYEIPIIRIWRGYNLADGEPDSGGSIDDIFDDNGKDESDPSYDFDKIHIGDFINYIPGYWNSTDINNIKTGDKGKESTANGIYELPEDDYQFGGFEEGALKGSNAIPRDSEYNYIQEKNSTGDGTQSISGWRVFDVNTETNEIVLISAGCPEDYFQPKTGNGGYIGEYILTGIVNPNWDAMGNEGKVEEHYTKRDWSAYVNPNQGGVSARALRKEDLDSWYKKYIENVDGDVFEEEQFRLIYETKYENLIDNYSYYWLGSAADNNNLYYFTPDKRNLSDRDDRAFGVRVLVTLNAENLRFFKATVDTKTVISRGNEYTYSVWDVGMQTQ